MVVEFKWSVKRHELIILLGSHADRDIWWHFNVSSSSHYLLRLAKKQRGSDPAGQPRTGDRDIRSWTFFRKTGPGSTLSTNYVQSKTLDFPRQYRYYLSEFQTRKNEGWNHCTFCLKKDCLFKLQTGLQDWGKSGKKKCWMMKKMRIKNWSAEINIKFRRL